MSEAIIMHKRSKNENMHNKTLNMTTEVITENTKWIMPDNILNNEISVRIFGAGGITRLGVIYTSDAGNPSHSNCGGGGWMNNDNLIISPGTEVEVTIGKTPSAITSFGTFISANGASGINGGSGGGGGGIGYQFGGGGGGFANNSLSDGGIWGGGGGTGMVVHSGNRNSGISNHSAGNGGIYGGGGSCTGSIYSTTYSSVTYGLSGSGGMYGGSGGTGPINNSTFGNGDKTVCGNSGEFGGNGSNRANTWAENGTDISRWNNIPELDNSKMFYKGNGHGGYNYGGGGGFGGIGGNNCGGGGGYGSNGGDGYCYTYTVSKVTYTSAYGGGGGGYGGDGGNGGKSGGGGGGGYGKSAKGGDNCGGGGGYFSRGGSNCGGGGSYGDGAYFVDGKNLVGPGYGGGGFKTNIAGWFTIFGPGICIIQYYVKE